ncbi:MAG: hypothetical protein QW434_04250 [Pyrobaculum sp.]
MRPNASGRPLLASCNSTVVFHFREGSASLFRGFGGASPFLAYEALAGTTAPRWRSTGTTSPSRLRCAKAFVED